MKHLVEQNAQERLVHRQPRQPAEHQHDHGGDQRHHLDAPRHDRGHGERDQHRYHEGAARDKNPEARIDGEEQHQRPDVEHQLEDGVELLLFGHGSFLFYDSSPTMARAKSRAVKAARSSTPSPTPMKCTGRPKRAAIATRMPPRAVPSSLVITKPVTPAILPKIST